MECILRVSGADMNLQEVASAISATPYRIDHRGEKNARANCLHYSVASGETDAFTELRESVRRWLNQHQEISRLRDRTDIEQVDLDFGVFLDEDVIASSYGLDTDFLDLAARLGTSITISIYKTASERDR
jgi:hypothetical protein